MKSKSFVIFSSALIATMFASPSTLAALPTWDSGAAAGDTNINTAANWNPDETPTFESSLQGIFATTTAANININVTFGPTTSTPALAFSSNFTMNAGGGILTVYGTNSGTQSVLHTNSGASAVTINAQIEIFATSPSLSPVVNLLVIPVNNTSVANTALNITGGISKAKINSAISGMGSISKPRPHSTRPPPLPTHSRQAILSKNSNPYAPFSRSKQKTRANS